MLSLIIELKNYFFARKKYWLLPIVIMSFVFGGLLVLSHGSAIAPFIYTIF